MINTRTVFIVGAGASCPFGFPSGQSLLDELTTTAAFPLDDVLEGEREYVHREMDDFKKRLRRSGANSVDDFLQNHQKAAKFGKKLIASCLIKREICNKLTCFCEGHWLRRLWQTIKAPPTIFPANKCGFIVYNYDRCVEHYLTVAMAETYGISHTKAWESVSQIPIIHPHGLLAPYQPEDPSITFNFKARNFDAAHSCHSVNLAANHIRLFWEPISHSDQTDASGMPNVQSTMKTLLTNANRVIFLGFGFLKSNTEHLFPMLPANCAYSGTCFRMPKVDVNAVGQKIQAISRLGFANLHDRDCLGLLEDVVDLS